MPVYYHSLNKLSEQEHKGTQMKSTGPALTTARKRTLRVHFMAFMAFWITWFLFSISGAQVVPITSSGLNTQIGAPSNLPSGKVEYGITGGTRPGGGANLFHSFGNFNVPINSIANFLNDSALPTSNILGRVTGGNISNIFGTIQTTGFGNANLFLMNPAGFLFGPNAALNVGGMVAFTTADYLRLEDVGGLNAGIFHADSTQTSVLTTAPVVAFGFLGSNPGAITVQGSQLTVAEGTGLSLIGGNITIGNATLQNGTVQPARLSAPNGQINLATAASPGEFIHDSLQTGGFQSFEGFSFFSGPSLAGPDINGTSFTSFGAIHLAPGSTVDTSQNSNGRVSVKSGQLVVDIQNALLSTVSTTAFPSEVVQNNVLISPGSSIYTLTSSADPGPDTQIDADNIQVRGTAIELQVPPTIATISADTAGDGPAGNISLTARQNLELFTAVLGSGTFATVAGKAGNIDLTSTQGNISIMSSSLVTSQGNAGNLSLTAPHGDILLDSSVVFTNLFGDAPLGVNGGAIRVTANNLSLRNGLGFLPASIEIDNFNPEVPGPVTVNLSGRLSLEGNATIQTIARGPALAASDLNITAHDVSITGGSVLNTQTQSSGAAGRLNIFSDDLQITNGGQIRSGTALGRDPLTGEPIIATGPGGIINIQGLAGSAQTVLIDGAGSSILTSTVGTGVGGDIFVSADTVTLQNGGTLSADTFAAGNAGNVQVHADSVSVTTGGQLTSSSSVRQTPFFEGEVIPSPTGNAGNVTIQGLASPSQFVLIDGSGSGTFTNTQGTGTGGNISVSANSITLQNGGTLSAATSGTASSATGGTITVNAEQVALNTQGLITADTNGIAPAGVIDINTGTLAINSGGQIRSSSGPETQQLRTLALTPPSAPLTGGTITIQGRTGTGSQADSVTIDGAGSGVFTESTGTRPGGDINILASQSVAMTNGAQISASSTGMGNAGNIEINAGNQLAMNSSSVTTEANRASGGAIKITTTPSGSVQLTDSTITASVLDGTGGGGSVDIDPQFVILQNSQILAKAFQGPGGNISITTNLLLPDTTSIIDASSQFGQQGNIVIQSPVSPASGKIIPLGQKPLIATALLSQRCAALSGGNASSFTVAGRDSLPAEPGGWVSSPLALSMAESNEGTPTETALSRLGKMAEETPLLSLRKVAPAGFLTQNFGAASSDCQS
jgi:filamentous hemagglutinin family protein